MQKRPSRRAPTEKEMIVTLQRGEVSFPPLRMSLEALEARRGDRTADGIVRAAWGRNRYRFVLECKSEYTPKVIAAAADQARRWSAAMRLNPLVIVPYLSTEQLDALLAQGVSGLDLCGNGVLEVPGELLVYRTGAPNRFPRAGTIKNVYRCNSSIVARVFLAVPSFASVNEAWAKIDELGGRITLPTVSKVCAALDADLVVERTRDQGSRNRRLRLIQPEKLLELLAENYAPPAVRNSFTGKYNAAPGALAQAFAAWQQKSGKRVVRTGVGSVDAYAVMAREPIQSFYCSDLAGILNWLSGDVQSGERFANLRLLETKEEFVYFDTRAGLIAPPIQTCLELATGDKRDQETAEQVRRFILDEVRLAKIREERDGSAAGKPA
jgi:hypothetical protein